MMLQYVKNSLYDTKHVIIVHKDRIDEEQMRIWVAQLGEPVYFEPSEFDTFGCFKLHFSNMDFATIFTLKWGEL